MFKSIITAYLFVITRIVLLIYKPTVIVIAGQSNKTLVKQTIVDTLKQQRFSVRANPRQWNAEIGLPLSILYVGVDKHTVLGWLLVTLRTLGKIANKHFPQFLVLELGFNKPGDMAYLTRLLRPNIAVITNIKPMYMENFNDDINRLTSEFAVLCNEVLQRDGILILNSEIRHQPLYKETKREKIIIYSLSDNTDIRWRITDIKETQHKQTFTVRRDGHTEIIETKIPGSSPREAHIIAQIIKTIL